MPPPNSRNPRQAEPAAKSFFQLPLIALLALVVLLSGAALYQLQAVKTDLAQVRNDQAAIQNELREMNKLFRQRGTAAPQPPGAAPAYSVVSIANARVKGRADAPLTLVEFSDYQ